MNPYYSEGGITIYYGKAEDLLPGLSRHYFGVLVMDPPYTFRLDRLTQFNDYLIENDSQILIPGSSMATLSQFGHPHARPLNGMLRLLEPTSGPILDPYMGSASTLVAAKQLGREAVGIEIAEGYCQAAVEQLRRDLN